MDDSGTSALRGAAEALRRLFFGPERLFFGPEEEEDVAAAGDSRASPTDGTQQAAREKPTMYLHAPVWYCTDSTVADRSRPRARQTATSGHLRYPEERITRSRGAELQWVDQTGPPVLTGLPDLQAPAPNTAPTQMPALHGVPPLGGQAREDREESRGAAATELPRAGVDKAAQTVATPVRVREAEESLTRSVMTMEEDAMSHLTMSMQRLWLHSPKKVRGTDEGRACLQPPKLDLGEDTVPQGPSRDPSRKTDQGHGRVSHKREGDTHFPEADDSKETPHQKKQRPEEKL
jgi:hypothetical protein